MEPRDYHLWKQMQNDLRLSPEANGIFEELEKLNTEEELDDEVFEAVSKRAWTDILLQILKVTIYMPSLNVYTISMSPLMPVNEIIDRF